jgi:hypothetical protein
MNYRLALRFHPEFVLLTKILGTKKPLKGLIASTFIGAKLLFRT